MKPTPDFRHRAQLTELMDEPCTREELRACLRDLAQLNRWFLGYRPVLHWLSLALPASPKGPIRILDVGCGYGDTLRRIERWALRRGIKVELAGLDINPDTAVIAAEGGPSNIRWISADVFRYEPEQPVDCVISSLFTHHLGEADVVRFLEWMESHARLGWFINDLSRAPVPYHLLRIFAKLARLHPFVQHDGPVSIARAFVREDWERMCAAAGLTSNAVSIVPFKPARLCVMRTKPR
ncbi:MAG: methyltransferase domain-containing protein [Candidatus Sulfotelmatobacter sp.]